MQENEKIYRIELTNEEYEFLENLKTEFCNKFSKMSDEGRAEYLKSLYPEQNLNFEKEIKGTVYKVNTYFNKDAEDNKFQNIKFFVDDGYSGTTFTRPAFMEIMELAEQGKIGTIIVKDHSRLGRNRLVVGQLLEEDFVRLNIRYIAIMDNIDSSKGLNDFLPIQDWFNEMHAKNTSQKVRAVLKNKGESGISLANNVPYGYKKDETDKTKWVIDEPSAKIVREIYNLFIQGHGTCEIARILRERKILTPSEYNANIGTNSNANTQEYQYKWCGTTVASILDRQEYDERFRNLSFNYDKEQKELKTKIEQLSNEIDNTEKKTTDLTQFISNVKKYTEITELTPEILNELIEKILVHQTEKIDGKKVQEIDIYYRGVGIISFPVSLEDMAMVIEKMLNERITA